MIKQILDSLYPRRCVLCHSLCAPEKPHNMDLCHDCQADLPLIEYACFQCGIPLHQTQNQQRCGQCLQKTPAYDHVISIYHYQNPLIWLIQQMKFKKKSAIANLLGHVMSIQLKQHNTTIPDAIIPVPLHYKRQLERHFNQSEEMAKVVAKKLLCPLDTQYLERHLPSKQQSGLDAKQRRKNVKGIFRVKNKKQNSYRHIALIDDVMSTGSTVNEISKTLKKNGVEKVDVWILARADNK